MATETATRPSATIRPPITTYSTNPRAGRTTRTSAVVGSRRTGGGPRRYPGPDRSAVGIGVREQPRRDRLAGDNGPSRRPGRRRGAWDVVIHVIDPVAYPEGSGSRNRQD